MRKFMRSNFSAFILAFALIACTCIPAFATTSLQYVYRSADSNGNVISQTRTANKVNQLISKSEVVLEDSKWYYPYIKTVEITSITVSGDAHLILSKGHTLTVKKGIHVREGSSLTIYGQPNGDGTLIATGDSGQAGIGGFNGDPHNASITITIHGGNITATGGEGAAGIGCAGILPSSITIYGGTITATGGKHGAGIGNNVSTLNTTITIYGGEITAAGGTNGAGIGGGMNKGLTNISCGTVNIYGGTITATGSRYGHVEAITDFAEYYPAGIGGGNRFANCAVNIYGGNITAKNYRDSTSDFRDGYGIRGQITLSYKNANDLLYATNYGGTVTVADGKSFIVDGTEISGTVEVVKVEKALSQTETEIIDTCPALDGKTLIPPSYNVNVGTNRITASTAKAFPGETVTVSPAEGYNLTSVNVNGTAITGNTFTMPANDVTVTATTSLITYTITYDLDGGTVSTANTAAYTIETATFTLNNPTKTGYTFAGWSSFAGGVKVVNYTIKQGSTGDKTLIANWTVNQYTLTFDTQGGSEVSAITQDYDTAIIAPTDPVKENYKFNGWDKTIPAKMPAENMTFTARWTAESYTINYELNGGTVTSNPTSYTIESEAMTLNNPTKAGYTFKGWTGTDITGTVETVTIAKGSTGNRTYTAVFEKNLSHWGKTDSYVPDGSESNPYVISTLDGWNLLADELTNGNDYSGQFFRLSNDLTVTTMLGTSETGFAVTFEGNGKTLTFNYEGADDYCAPFCYVDGGTIKDLTVTGTIKTSGQHIGGIIGQSSGNTAIEACNFVGKLLTTNTDITIGGGFVAENNGTLTISDSLYAPATLSDGETEPSATGTTTFSRNTESHTSEIMNSYYTRKLGTEQGKQGYTVTAETGITVALAEGSTNGLSFDGTIYAGSNETVSLTISGGNTKEAYAFKGYKASTGTLTESGGKYSLTMPEGNVTISAEFVENISYIDADGQNATTSDYTVLTSSMTSLTAGTYVVKENVTLSALTLTGDVNLILCDGATLSVTGNVSGANSLVVYGQDSGTGTLTAANITLTDNKNLSVYGGNLTAGTISVAGTVTVKRATVNNETYDANGDSTTNYTVTFDSNGGSAIDSQTLKFKYGEIVKATKPADPTRDNYGFVEWQLNGTAYDFGTAVTGDMTLTAKWTATEYTITYNGTDEATFTTANPTKYTVETETFTLNNPTKNGSTFAGWTGTGLSGATMTVEIAKGSTGARTYTATWTGGGSTPDPDAPVFKGQTLILGGQIGVIFYVDIPETYRNPNDCWMEFEVSGDEFSTSDRRPQSYNGDDYIAGPSGENCYKFTCYINSVQMADNINAILHYGSGCDTVTYQYTALTYLNRAMNADSGYEADVVALATAINDFGSYVQPVLAEENHWQYGVDHVKMNAVSSYSDNDFERVKSAVSSYALNYDKSSSTTAGIANIGHTLQLESTTTLIMYLAPSSDYTGKVYVKVDNGTEEEADYSSGNNYYVVIIENIAPHELDDSHTITVRTEKGTFGITVYALSYVNSVLNSANSNAMKEAVTSLYEYYAKTVTYRSNRPNEYGNN